MTVEQLLDLPAKDVATMSTDELTAILIHHFPFTRPSKRAGSVLDVILEGNPDLAAKLAAMTPTGTRTKLKLN